MPIHPRRARHDRHWQTARGVRTLVMLGVACALFVTVVYVVVTPAAEPPLAAQSPEADPTVVEPAPGT